MPKDGGLWRDLHRVLPQEHHHAKIKFEGNTNMPQHNEAHVMLPRCNKNGKLDNNDIGNGQDQKLFNESAN